MSEPTRKRPCIDVETETGDQKQSVIEQRYEGGNTRGDLMSKVKSLLTCPVCYYMIRPPVEMCENGHSICQQCDNQMETECPVCRGQIVNLNNRTLTRISRLVKYPCINKRKGCQEVMHLKDEKDHMKQCPHVTPPASDADEDEA